MAAGDGGGREVGRSEGGRKRHPTGASGKWLEARMADLSNLELLNSGVFDLEDLHRGDREGDGWSCSDTNKIEISWHRISSRRAYGYGIGSKDYRRKSRSFGSLSATTGSTHLTKSPTHILQWLVAPESSRSSSLSYRLTMDHRTNSTNTMQDMVYIVIHPILLV